MAKKIIKAGTHTRRNSHKSHKCRRGRSCHKSSITLRNLLDLLEFYDERTHTNLGSPYKKLALEASKS